MRIRNHWPLLAMVMMLAVVSGCATSQPPSGTTAMPSEESQLPAREGTISGAITETLAIMPFENNSVDDPAKYEPLTKGLAAMLISDLSRRGTGLKLIERDKIQSLLKEIALSQTGSVDDATAVNAGKVLGAKNIALGSFMVLGPMVRIDTRIIRVETSEMIMAESISGRRDDFIDLQQELAVKVAKSLKIALAPARMIQSEMKSGGIGGGSDIEAALRFSEGLDALDRGDKETARQRFDESIALDPNYQSQVDDIKGW